MIPTNLLPEKWRNQWCIAGGYAACPALATDIDVWVYNIHEQLLTTAREELLEHLATTRLYFIPQPLHKGDGIQKLEPDEMEYVGKTLKVADVWSENIHLLVTSAKTVEELLDTFDISTSMAAILSNGKTVRGKDYTHPGRPPQVIRMTPTTQVRLLKLCERFGHPYYNVKDE